MRAFSGGMRAAIFIIGLMPVLFWADFLRQGGRIKKRVVIPVVVAILCSLYLTILIDSVTAKFVLLPGALGVVLMWFYYKGKSQRGGTPTDGPGGRTPAQRKHAISELPNEEPARKVAGDRSARFKGQWA